LLLAPCFPGFDSGLAVQPSRGGYQGFAGYRPGDFGHQFDGLDSEDLLVESDMDSEELP
jgi:hypothetical protein